MSKLRKTHSASFKAKVALAALSQTHTIAEICSQYGVHATQVHKWKKDLQDNMADIFVRKGKKDPDLVAKEELIEELYKQVGQQKVENDWLKKKVDELPP